MKEYISVDGFVEGYIKRKSGLLEPFGGKNLVVTTGKNLIVSRLAASSANPVTYMGIGTSATPAALADTSLLGTELERKAATNNSSGNLFSLQTTFGAGILFDTDFAEFGLFNAAAGGTMLCRFVIASRTFTVGDTVLVNWSLQFGS